MKTNEAPENIYIDRNDGNYYLTNPNGNSIEYIRTDAFIEKAAKWLREFNNHHEIIRYSDSCEPPLSELTEWFKNYLKEK